jgi:hypothetical protein
LLRFGPHHDAIMTTSEGSDTLEISQASVERQLTAETKDGSLEQRARVYEIDPVVEKRLRRKLDRRLMSLLFVAYMLAFLDRSNVGNAETADMGKDLGFDDAHYQVRFVALMEIRLMLMSLVVADHLLHPLQ